MDNVWKKDPWGDCTWSPCDNVSRGKRESLKLAGDEG
jgi:hypothetical protein